MPNLKPDLEHGSRSATERPPRRSTATTPRQILGRTFGQTREQTLELQAVFGSENPVAALIELREERIRVCAYFKAERRGFAPGHALQDWLAAEQEIDDAFRPL